MPKHAAHVNDIVQAMSIKYNNLVYEMQSQGVDVIVLSLGKPSLIFLSIPLMSYRILLSSITLTQEESWNYAKSWRTTTLSSMASPWSRKKKLSSPLDPRWRFIWHSWQY